MPDGIHMRHQPRPLGPVFVGLYGADPSDPERASKGGTQGLRERWSAGGPLGSTEIPSTPEKEGVGVVIVIVVVGRSHSLTPGRDLPLFETMGRPGCFQKLLA